MLRLETTLKYCKYCRYYKYYGWKPLSNTADTINTMAGHHSQMLQILQTLILRLDTTLKYCKYCRYYKYYGWTPLSNTANTANATNIKDVHLYATATLFKYYYKYHKQYSNRSKRLTGNIQSEGHFNKLKVCFCFQNKSAV